MVSKEKKRNKNLEKMHWSAADPTFQEATDYVMHFLMRRSRKHTVWKSPQKLSFFNFRNFQKISGQILSFKSKPKKKTQALIGLSEIYADQNKSFWRRITFFDKKIRIWGNFEMIFNHCDSALNLIYVGNDKVRR